MILSLSVLIKITFNRCKMAIENNVNEEEGVYDILQNAAGEILIIIRYRNGGPENPRLIYDGGKQALLYRSRESAVILENIDPEAKTPLQSVDEVLVVELDGEEVAREYTAPLRVVKKAISI